MPEIKPDMCKCSVCNTEMEVSQTVSKYGHHDGWEMPAYTQDDCPFCKCGGCIDDYFFKEFEMRHLHFDDHPVTDNFSTESPNEWFLRKGVEWFYRDHVLTLGVGEYVDTDFQRITRMR